MTPEERAIKLLDDKCFSPYGSGLFLVSAEELLEHEHRIAAAIREAVADLEDCRDAPCDDCIACLRHHHAAALRQNAELRQRAVSRGEAPPSP